METYRVSSRAEALMSASDYLNAQVREGSHTLVEREVPSNSSFLCKVYGLLMSVVMKEETREYGLNYGSMPLPSNYECVENLLFYGKIHSEQTLPDLASLCCTLCMEELHPFSSRVFYTCQCCNTLTSTGICHASCFASQLIMLDSFATKFREIPYQCLAKNIKCALCTSPIKPKIVAILPVTKNGSVRFFPLHKSLEEYDGIDNRVSKKPFMRQRFESSKTFALTILKHCPWERGNIHCIPVRPWLRSSPP